MEYSIDTRGYPTLLSRIPRPPRLWTNEALPALTCCVCFAGSRKAPWRQLRRAWFWAGVFTRLGWQVVTSDETGCDQAARMGVLAAGGKPLVVHASGLPLHAGKSGLSITPFPPGTRKSRETCLLRNRVTTGMAGLLVIPYAGPGSGAYLAAGDALDEGRDVVLLEGAQAEGMGRILREEGAGILVSCVNATTFVLK